MRTNLWIGLAVLLAPGSPAAAPVEVVAPVDEVVVYSTQARVVRRAWVNVKGNDSNLFELADLPAAVIADSLEVSVPTAQVERVSLVRRRKRLAPARELGDPEKLIKVIRELTDLLDALQDERRALQSELRYLASLTVSTASLREGQPRPQAAVLHVGAWPAIMGWADQRGQQIDRRILQIDERQLVLRRRLTKARIQAQAFAYVPQGQLGSRVAVTLRGAGRHRVSVSYSVHNARWYPAYDLRYDHRARAVELAYYAEVSQASGEDWDQPKLSFSTIEPENTLAVPELPTWIVGRKRDFVPTTQLRPEPAQAQWWPREVMPAVRRDPVQQRLITLLAWTARHADQGKESDGVDMGGDQTRIADKLRSVMGAMGGKASAADRPAETKYPASPPMPVPQVVMPAAEPAKKAYGRSYAYRSKRRVRLSQRVAREESAETRATSGEGFRARPPVEQLAWSDVGYQPRWIDPSLPAAAAQGFRYTLHAPGRHAVDTTNKSRRVPLFRRRFQVIPSYRIVPGKSKTAYFVAKVTNRSGHPILRGQANLFAGAMYRGHSSLETALPGREIKINLGVDDSIKVERFISQQTVVEGMFFKDDVTEYTVRLQIANHRPYSVEVELEDQVPLKSGRKIEVKAFQADPQMKGPHKDTGKVKWKGTIAGSSVKKLTFKYRIVRPKDWDLHQVGG
jgi:hypothetical protein